MNGSYVYSDHLLALEACETVATVRMEGDCLVSPLSIKAWSDGLSSHPDRNFAEFIIRGISQGFRVGFNRSVVTKSATSNLAVPFPEVVDQYLRREVQLNRMHALPREVAQGIHISPLGIIPKKNKPGKWRLIVDLSAPKGRSINDGICQEVCTISYTTVDMLANLVNQAGQGSYLVKADIKEAYRNIPVHPDDQHLLGIQWEDVVYVDKVLPFGLRSAPKIFTAVADAAQWMLSQRGVPRCLHYLDDFAIVEPDLETAKKSKRKLGQLFEELGLPLEPSKLEGPVTCLTFLGIEVDTVRQELRLPVTKMERLVAELHAAAGRKSLKKKELQSLTGLLQHACKVVRPGRAFLQRLYALQSVGSAPNHNIRLNRWAKADILWWQLFVD